MTITDLIASAAKNEAFNGVMGGSLVLSLIYSLKSVPGELWSLFLWRFTTELLVFNEDAAFDVVSDWLSELDLAKKARRLRMTSSYSDHEQTDVTRLSPGIGIHLIWYKRYPVLVSRYIPDKLGHAASYKRREDICIRTVGTSSKLMRDLVSQIVDAREKASRTHVEVYTFHGYWKMACRRNKRPLESVVMPEAQRAGIVEDIETFLVSRPWYAKRGIPYRRGLLLCGPPGTGKTSLVMALASHLSKRIYALNLGSVNGDEQLIEAVTSVPENGILLIEDIDAAQTTREELRQPEEATAPDTKGPPRPQPISLSALLNAIDGVFSRDGRILIMTTNYEDKIDPALRRPGRADRVEFIGGLGRREVQRMCRQFVDDAVEADEIADGIDVPIAPAELQRVLLCRRAEAETARRVDAQALEVQ